MDDDALVIGENRETGEPITILLDDFLTGFQVYGGSRRGKSRLLSLLMDGMLRITKTHGDGGQLTIVDPHGPLAQTALLLCMQHGTQFAERVVYFSLRDPDRLPIFNPLRTHKDYGPYAAIRPLKG